jgi:hypothetical protein
LDYLQALTTSAPIFDEGNTTFPEVIAVNAFYTPWPGADCVEGETRWLEHTAMKVENYCCLTLTA